MKHTRPNILGEHSDHKIQRWFNYAVYLLKDYFNSQFSIKEITKLQFLSFVDTSE